MTATLGSRDLVRLAKVYKSDKWNIHRYASIYDVWFARFRKRRIAMLEIGVGGYDHPRRGGRSLRMWQKYFSKATITGVDIHDKTALAEPRIRIFQGDQSDPAFLSKVSTEAGPFDIIIDDGSHVQSHVITSFETLFPLMNAGGIYIVEDTQTSYWPEYGGSTSGMLDVPSAMNYFIRRIHGVNRDEWLNNEKPPAVPDEGIAGIAFYHNLILITKRADAATES